MQALRRGDFDALGEALAGAGLKLEGEVDITTLLSLVGVLLGNQQPGESGEDIDRFDVSMQIGKSIDTIPTDLLLVGRALGMLDSITKQLDPDMDTIQIVSRYV